ncbi:MULTISPECIES: hypothetical protein [unclassified Bradyrhizobium]
MEIITGVARRDVYDRAKLSGINNRLQRACRSAMSPIDLEPFRPVDSSETNGMAEPFANSFKRHYIM